MPKVGVNEPCPCGSGRKYKKCCREKDEPARTAPDGQPDGVQVPLGARVVRRGGDTFIVSEGMSDKAINDAVDFFKEKDLRGGGFASDIAEFSRPLLDGVPMGDTKEVSKATNLGLLFWNLARVEDEKERAAGLDRILKEFAPTDESREAWRHVAEQMLERHKAMFPDMHRQERP